MKDRIEIPAPMGGISDDQAFEKQVPGTTPIAKNVRPRNPRNSRAQMSQRAGYKNFTASALRADRKVDAITTVSVDLPKVEYFGPDRSLIVRKWGHTVPGLREALAVTTDRNGNLYVLDASGVFQKLGPEGEVESTQTVYVPNQEVVVPRIQVDREGNVYVAVTSPGGTSARVVKYRAVEVGDEDEDQIVYDEAWNVGGFYGIRDFRVYGGRLAVSRFYSDLAKGLAPADVIVYGALFGVEPVELYETATPAPVSTIDINDSGDVLAACPANADRTATVGNEGWSTSVEAWSPHELEDSIGYGAAKRLHWWTDPTTLLGEYADGAKVGAVPDRRWLRTPLDLETIASLGLGKGAIQGDGTGAYLPPLDYTPRNLRQVGYHSNVRFRPNGAGTMPTIEFPGGGSTRGHDAARLMASTKLAEVGNKSDSTGDGLPDEDGRMKQVAGVIPPHRKAVFATFIVFRYNLGSDRMQMVWHHSSTGINYALVLNGDGSEIYKNSTHAVDNGKLSLYVGDALGNKIARNAAGTGGGVALNSADLYSTTAPDDYANDQRVAIVCIQHGGSTHGTGPAAAGVGECLFRVNGRTAARFSITTGEGSANGVDAFGSPMATGLTSISQDQNHFGNLITPDGIDAQNLQNVTQDLQNLGNLNDGNTIFKNFDGELMEVVTILGSTATPNTGIPNEDPVTAPIDTSTGKPVDAGTAKQWTYMGGLPYGTTAEKIAYTQAASEIERMEGYLAYKWGCPGVLRGGAAPGAATNGLVNVHPFGLGVDGGAATDPVPPVGSPAAGPAALSEAALAMLSSKELLFKVGPSGSIAWALAGGGHGLGVKSGADRTILAVGRHDGASTVVAKRVVDNGNSVRTTGDDTWEVEEDAEPAPAAVPGLDVDDAGNLYWPRTDSPNSILVNFLAAPNNGEQIFLSDTEAVFSTYTFQTTLAASTGVTIGASKEEAAANFAAAVNDGGDDSVQYGTGIVKHESWKAAVETDGSTTNVRLTRTGLAGLAQVTVPVALVRLTLSEVPSDATQPSGLANTSKFGLGVDPRIEMRSAEDGAVLWSKYYTGAGDQVPHAIALDPDLPLYPNDDPLEGVPEHVYVAQRNNVDTDGETLETPTGDNVQKLRQVERRQVIGKDKSPRRTVHVAACDGHLFVVAKDKKPALVNNGLNVFNSDSPFIKLFSYRENIYGLDGQSYIRFNPKTLLVEEWKADGAGKIPYGAKLGCVWNQRIILSRTPDDPHNLYMSERGNPDGWDTDPAVITPLSAFSGAASGNLHFEHTDLVNTIIPASQETLIIGGDTSISLLSGDPGSGGAIQNVTKSEGLAFGDAYAIAPDGTVFAKGINGGIWRIALGGGVDRISLRTIERRIQDINLKEYDVRMAWNFAREGLHVFQVPKGLGARTVQHWFWDAKGDSWWEDEFSVVGVQPTAVAILDGDHPDDRILAIGCEDGYIRFEDEATTDDGGNRIISELVIGPLKPGDVPGKARFSHLEVTTSSNSDPIRVEVFTDQITDVVAGRDAKYTGTAGPGYRGYNMFQASANQAWIKLSNSAEGETFSLESLYIRARQSSRRRVY